ncbi:LuxR family transcriptional regulator, partial [Phocaeicola vulgatus]|nr:LuxR family transcriptional regulator [Phocaeicola vulgatus]
ELYTLSKELLSGSKLCIVEQEISHNQYQNLLRKAELREQAYEIELLKRKLFVLVIIFMSLIVLSIFL